MLEFFRRHRGAFLISLTVIIILSFTVWGGWKKSGMAGPRSGEDRAATIYGKDFTFSELARLDRFRSLYYQLGGFNTFMESMGIEQLAEETKNRDSGGLNYDFVGNLMVLRKQATEFGMAVSEAEAKKKLETLEKFQKDGKFDQATAAATEKNLGAMGFTSDDMVQAAKDLIIYGKLKDLVGANYSPSPLSVSKSYASKQQTIKASTIQFALDDFKKKAEVKDEEIAKYYEEKKETYKTPEKRGAAVVAFVKPTPDPKANEEKDEKKKAEAAAKQAKAVTDFEKDASDFDVEFRKPGADINKLVADFNKKNAALNLKVENIAPFEKATPPESIKSEARLVSEIFSAVLKVGGHGEPVESPKGYYFCKITQIDAPKQQELKEVKDKIKEELVSQKAQTAMTAAANDARTAINEALKAGKKLDAVLKEKNLKAEDLPEFSPNNPPPNNPQGAAIATAASDAPANSVASNKTPITNDKGLILVVVNAKELRKRDDADTLKDSEQKSLVSSGQNDILKSWFRPYRAKAALKPRID